MDAAVLQTLALAAELHRDQVDKIGRPYVGHLIRVARNVAEMQAEMSEGDPGFFESAEMLQAAVLHDALEDQRERYEMGAFSLPSRVQQIVQTLSRGVGEPYEAFIERIAASGLDAILIKLADLRDNLDPGRRSMLPEADRAAPAKYLAARERLLRAVEHLGYRPPVIASTR